MSEHVGVAEKRVVNLNPQSTSQNQADFAATPLVSLVIPAYNEEARLGASLDKVSAYLSEAMIDAEIVVVDDGSNDRTVDIANTAAKGDSRIRVLSIPHAGKAAAVRAGMMAARGEFVAFTDADLATPLTYLAEFIALAKDGADVVIGSREGIGSHRIGEPWYRHVMGRVFNRMVQLLVLPGIEDTQCGFKLFRGEAMRAILSRSRLYADRETVTGPRVTAFDVEYLVIARELGFTVVTEPVIWTYGTNSKVNPVRDTLHNARDILQIKRNVLLGRYQS